MLGSHPPKPMVNERGFPNPGPANDRYDYLPMTLARNLFLIGNAHNQNARTRRDEQDSWV
jgi:hypothetical protein